MAPPSPADWPAAEARAAIAAAPRVGLEALCPAGPLLVLAPHPDDESLGCGGLIALAAAAGREVTVAVLTGGEGSHPRSAAYPPARLAALRRAEAQAALRVLSGGRARLLALGGRDGALDEGEASALAALRDLRPAAVFATWAADPHPDHQAAFRVAEGQAAASGARLYAYPVWGLTLPDAAPAGRRARCLSLDVASVLPLKARAIAAHRSQTTALIGDDPQGFRLCDADIARHLEPGEPYFDMTAAAAG